MIVRCCALFVAAVVCGLLCVVRSCQLFAVVGMCCVLCGVLLICGGGCVLLNVCSCVRCNALCCLLSVVIR